MNFARKISGFGILISILTIMLLSCSSTRNIKSRTLHLAVGSNPAHSYELYLPEDFDSTLSYPVVFSFDSHGSGSTAIQSFKPSADKFGFIIVGSNLIKNGVPDFEKHISQLIEDVQTRYKTINQALFTAGFSGGARMANYYTLKNQLAGVISCGAGFHYSDIRTSGSTAYVINLAGTRDCNMQETAYLPGAPECEASNYITLNFKGIHSWPTPRTIGDAMAFLYARLIIDKVMKESEISISELKDTYLNRADSIDKAGNKLELYKTLELASKMFYGSDEAKGIDKRMEEITNDAAFQQSLQEKEQLLQLEGMLDQGYLEAITKENSDWWTRELKALDDSTRSNHNPDMVDMMFRARSYIGLVCFSLAANASKNKDIAGLDKILTVYQMIEPGNPDVFYYKAYASLLKNKTDTIKPLLDKAVKLGFTDTARLHTDFPATIAKHY